MLSEWKEVPLSSLVTVKGGKRLPKGESLQTKPNSHPYIRVRDMGKRYLNKSDLEYVPNDVYLKIKRYIVKEDDVLISIVGTVGLVSVIDKELNLASQTENCAKLSGLTTRDSLFLYYYLSSSVGQQKIKEGTVGAVQAKLPLYSIERIPITWPERSTRNAIAHILGSLDDKIELNRKMNETLEAMAQALFKSWFVDFDPVIDNALAAGNEIPEELAERAEQRKALGDKRKPLPAEIQKLFPSEFIFTDELGWIPKGWKAEAVEKVIQVNPRVILGKGCVAPFADMKALPTAGFSINDIIKKPYSGGAKFNNGDVLLARITPCLENGKTGVVDFLKENEVGFGSTEFVVLRPTGAISTPFVACLARNESFREHCKQAMVGSSGRQRVQNACFTNFYLAIPEKEQILEQFTKLTKVNFNKVTKQASQSRSLTSLRDTLLPKLLSGELRIKDIEKLVEDAV